MVVAFIAAITLVPALPASAATPVAIPPGALPACTVGDTGGGWLKRDFTANGTDLANGVPVRVRSVRLGEPCFSGGLLNVPMNFHEVLAATATWSSGTGGSGGGGFSGGGGGGGGGGTAATPSSGTVPNYGTYDTKLLATPEWHVSYGGVDLWFTGNYHHIPSWSSGPAIDFDTVGCYELKGTLPAGLRFAGKTSVGTAYQLLRNLNAVTGPGPGTPCPVASHGGVVQYDPQEVPGYQHAGRGNVGNDMRSLAVCAQDPTTYVVGPCYGEVGGVVAPTTVGGEQASKMAIGVTSEFGGTTGDVQCATDNSGAASNAQNIQNQYLSDAAHPAQMNDPTPGGYLADVPVNFNTAIPSGCAFLQAIHLSICTWHTPSGPTAVSCEVTTWTYSAYAMHRGYGATTQDQAVCTGTTLTAAQCNSIVFPGYANPEAAYTCSITPAGPDIIAVVIDWVGKWGPFVSCELIPRGWDRSGLLLAEWNQAGPAAPLVAAYSSAVPSSIGCGPVASLPVFGRVIALDTCSADVAPDWVKVGVGWALVLVLSVTIVRRVLWSLGSN